MISSLGISCPINLFVLSKFNRIETSSGLFGYSSIISLETVPLQISQIKIAALFKAYSVVSIQIPLSNLKEASVLNECLFADFLIETGSKYALSKKIDEVSFEIP